jgi:hypothetical protein
MNPPTEAVKDNKKSNSFTSKLFGRHDTKVKAISVTNLQNNCEIPQSPKENDGRKKHTYTLDSNSNSPNSPKYFRTTNTTTITSPLSPDIVPIRMNDSWSPKKRSFDNENPLMGLSRNPPTKIDTSRNTEGDDSHIDSPLDCKSSPSSPSLKSRLLRAFTTIKAFADPSEKPQPTRSPSHLQKRSFTTKEKEENTPPESLVEEKHSPATIDLPTTIEIHPPDTVRNRILIGTPKPQYSNPAPLPDEPFVISNTSSPEHATSTTQNSPLLKPSGVKVTVRGLENLLLDTKPVNVRDTYSPAPDAITVRKVSKIETDISRSASSLELDARHSNASSAKNPIVFRSSSKILEENGPGESPQLLKKEYKSMNELSSSSMVELDAEHKVSRDFSSSAVIGKHQRLGSDLNSSTSGAELASRVVIGKSAQIQFDKPKTYPPSIEDSDSLASLDGSDNKISTASSDRTIKFKGIVKGIENMVLDTKAEKQEIVEKPGRSESVEHPKSLDSVIPIPKRKKVQLLNVQTQQTSSKSTNEEHSDGPLTALLDHKHRFSFMLGGLQPIADDETSLDTIKFAKNSHNSHMAHSIKNLHSNAGYPIVAKFF